MSGMIYAPAPGVGGAQMRELLAVAEPVAFADGEARVRILANTSEQVS